MGFRYTQLKSYLVIGLIFIGALSGGLLAQSIDGIYSNGEVSLHLEATDEGILGLFADSDGSYYEAYFEEDEDGLIGLLGEWAAYIPYDTEVLTLYIMPLDENEEPIIDDAIELQLDYISELYDDTQEMDLANVQWQPIKRFGSDFYPSYVLATSSWSQNITSDNQVEGYAYHGDRNGYFGVSIANLPIGSIIRVEVEGEPLAKSSSYTVTKTSGGIDEIFPIIEYDYEKLKNIDQARSLNFKYAVYVNDYLIGEQLEVVWVRSVNDAVTWAQDRNGYNYPLQFIFAAYVNENEPSLDPILGQALDYGIIDRWIGYQGDSEAVLKQIFTLWYHFQKQGVKYSSITTQSGSDELSAGQVVRFVGDALKTSQANCIDGTVLFASFLYKIGIDVSIILVPGHAYLGFSFDSEGNQKAALETVLVGNLDLEHSSSQQDLYNTMNGQPTSVQKSWDSFLGAVEMGSLDYHKNVLPGIASGDPRYMELNIKEARQQKIRPIK